MSFLDVVIAPSTLTARLMNPLQSLFALLVRGYVSAPFLSAGYDKYLHWDATLRLFEAKYPMPWPWLTPNYVAMAGTSAELLLPTFLVLGLYARLSAIGLFIVDALALWVYAAQWLDLDAPITPRMFGSVLLLVIILYGPGKLSIDYALNRARY
jgi:putative oxidoreductase